MSERKSGLGPLFLFSNRPGHEQEMDAGLIWSHRGGDTQTGWRILCIGNSPSALDPRALSISIERMYKQQYWDNLFDGG